MKDEAPDTLRPCEACGENPKFQSLCTWCTNGFQDSVQHSKWRIFRQSMKNISGTYKFLESTVEEFILELSKSTKIGAKELEYEGKRLMLKWNNIDPTSGKRNDTTSDLTDFVKRAIKLLTS